MNEGRPGGRSDIETNNAELRRQRIERNLIVPVDPDHYCSTCVSSISKDYSDRLADARAAFRGAFRGDFVKGFQNPAEIGWITLKDCDSPREYEQRIKELAIHANAIAAIKSNWGKRGESYVAGYGNRGNPYYQTRFTYSGSALLVKPRV